MMSKRFAKFLFLLLMLSLVVSPAWALTSGDWDSVGLPSPSLGKHEITGSSVLDNVLKNQFVIAQSGGGAGGNGGGAGGSSGGDSGSNGDCDGSGLQGGQGPAASLGPGPGGSAGQQNQNQHQHKHQHHYHYRDSSLTQAHLGPGDGTGNDGESPQDGTGYGADPAK